MATVAELKTKARELERQGQVDKALAIYRHLLTHLEGRRALEAELPLFVKVGDLELKQGRPDEAIAMYERAAERYVARGVASSVVALCLKILRVDAKRSSVYRRFACDLLDAGHVAAARDVLLDYAQRAKRPAAVAALERVTDRPDDEVRAALERMLAPAGTGVPGPRPAVDASSVTASGPRRAIDSVAPTGPGRAGSADGVTASDPRRAVAAEKAFSGPRPAVAPPAAPPPTASGPRAAVRLSPSREAEALDAESGPAALSIQRAPFREPFLARAAPEDVVEEEGADRAPPVPRVAPPERRRAFAGTVQRAERGRSRGAWRWTAAALGVLAAAALALGYFGLMPIDVRGLAVHMGLGRDAAADGSLGSAGAAPGTAAPVAVTDSSAADAAAARDSGADSADTNRLTPPRDAPRPRPVADSASAGEPIRPLGPPPPTNVPAAAAAETTSITAPSDRTPGTDSAGRTPGAPADPVRLPAGVTATGPVVVVPGLAIASLDESPLGHAVVHRLDGGELLLLNASRFGDGAATAPSPVRVTTLPGDTAVGAVRIGGFMVNARANVSADALHALLRQLVVVEPAGR